MSLYLAPCTVTEANAYVQHIHRHNGALPTAKFAVAICTNDGVVHGVAIAGAPKARMLMARGTLEVSRVATDGSRNACSMLYGACIRAARALGYRRLITYTLESEAGSSLRASGWTLITTVGGEGWARRQSARGDHHYIDQHDTGLKYRWEITLGEPVPEISWPLSNEDQRTLFDYT